MIKLLQECRNTPVQALTLMLLVANLGNTKLCKKTENLTETLAHAYSFDSTW